jgi:4-methylaminobutanoate oxidase (formaldehyde-forming)
VGAVPTRSHYWLTVPDGTGTQRHPNLMLPDFGAYFRPETGGMLVGVREAVSRTFDGRRLPADMDGLPLHDEAADNDLLADGLAAIRPHAPAIDGWRFRHHIAGLSTYTPDGKLVLGGFPGVEGFIVATGCCGSGVALSGGIGALVADLILGRPGFVDPAPFRPDRFGAADPSSAEFQARAAAARAGKGRGWSPRPGEGA